MDHAPADANAPMPSQLRQKMLNRASSVAEGVPPASPRPSRRRSSLLSTTSDAPHPLRHSASLDSLRRTHRSHDMDKLASSDDRSWWHSSPMFIAIVPAVATLYHPQGGTLTTDIVLLLLGAWFMQKCCTAPWEWYHDAQQKRYVQADEFDYDDTIHEEDEDSIVDSPQRPSTANGSTEDIKPAPELVTPPVDPALEAARRELRRTETMAFVACFLGPLLGAFVLHNIRSQFTHQSQDRIVTDMNLTICVLLAEMRPISRLIEMNKERTLHLQRIVKSASDNDASTGSARELAQRLAALEARMDSPSSDNSIDAATLTAQVRQTMQRQVDDLYRAVRKYEKKDIARTIQIEARFGEIDMRLKDTLSLAAAAARSGQKPGIVSVGLTWIASIFAFGIQLGWDVATYPFRLANNVVAMVRSSLFKDRPGPRKRSKGQYNGYTTPRMQAKNSR